MFNCFSPNIFKINLDFPLALVVPILLINFYLKFIVWTVRFLKYKILLLLILEF